MNRLHNTVSAAALLALGAAASPAAHADVKLPGLISDGMVLQQKARVRIFGTAAPGEAVTVSFRDQTLHAIAGPSGDWQVQLSPLTGGGPPATLTVQGKNQLTIHDVLVGEVWVCSGQSNMEFTLGGAQTGSADISKSTDPELRFFTVGRDISAVPQSDVAGGAWKSANPSNSGGFSAVGYYFARELRATRHVPVGMISSSWGGTVIEAWTRKETLLASGTPASAFKAVDEHSPGYVTALAHYQSELAKWQAAGSPQYYEDPGRAPLTADWAEARTDDSGWRSINAPGAWELSGIPELENLDGGVWFRRTITLSPTATGKSGLLSLGAIDDHDTTFVNGVQVGATGAETTTAWTTPRQYAIPVGVLKPGPNLIAIRVWDTGGNGGLSGPAEKMSLRVGPTGGSGETISLAGSWRYRIEAAHPSNPGAPPNAQNPNAPSVLYNGMIAPLTPYTIKGALWYQGESNAYNAVAYRSQMPALISNWRKDFGIRDLPFLMVQLAPFMAINPQPEDTDWAKLREAQLMATYALPGVGMAVITDVGDPANIHPTRKAPVGARLALLARHMAYGEKIVDRGPVYKEVKIAGDVATLTFDSAGGGLIARETDSAGRPVSAGALVGFSVAGADGKFVWADARITGRDTVTVHSPAVPHPVAVRFGWANYPVVNLYNAEGLPASPFRTDNK
jgi:sialate O-acetylesterase